jgi:hypothetical protein
MGKTRGKGSKVRCDHRCTQIDADKYGWNLTALPCEIRTAEGHPAPPAQHAELNRIPIQFRNITSSGFIRVHLYPSVVKSELP